MFVLEQIREKRQKKTGEVFTPAFLVKEMLDKLEENDPTTFKDPNKTFLDPSCGNGNFLIEVFRRKIKNGIDGLSALRSIFGVDLMGDNITECQYRLYQEFANHFVICPIDEIAEILSKNIRKENALTYGFSFNPNKKNKTKVLKLINKWKKVA